MTPGYKNGKGVICLYSFHKQNSIKHYSRDCKTCPKGENQKHLQEFFRTCKYASGGEKMRRITVSAANTKVRGTSIESSSTFAFAIGRKYRHQVCVDNLAR